MRLGTWLSSSAPVESQMRGSLGMKPGATGSEPAAMIALAKRTMRRALGGLDCERVRRGELALAADDRHLALARERGQAAGQALDDALLQAAHAVEVDAGRAEGDAVRGHGGGLVDHFGDMQQRLGRDAADVEADAAQRRAALDQHDLLAEIGGAEGGGVAARARAEHQHVAFEIGLFGRRPRSL